MHNIKQLKPSRTSHYRQSYVNPASCTKLFPSLRNQPIICRSSWERKFIQWCETNPNVRYWGSECISTSYLSPLDGKKHAYYPDFCVEMMNGEKWIVEVKPLNQTKKPNKEDRYLVEQYVKNMAKWQAIKEQCEPRGYKFIVLTEKTFDRMV